MEGCVWVSLEIRKDSELLTKCTTSVINPPTVCVCVCVRVLWVGGCGGTQLALLNVGR